MVVGAQMHCQRARAGILPIKSISAAFVTIAMELPQFAANNPGIPTICDKVLKFQSI